MISAMIVRTLIILAFLTAYTGSGIWFLHAAPREVDSPRWARCLAWGIYTVISVAVPTLFLNDVITMTALILCYLLITWFLYHRSRTWLLYGVVFVMANYAAQAIGIYLAAHLGTRIEMSSFILGNIMEILKSSFVVAVTYVLRLIVQKRLVSDREDLKIRGMVLVPASSMILIFLFCLSGSGFFEKYGYGWMIVYCVLFLIINVYCLYVWYDVAENKELKHRMELLSQQNELTHQYYEDMEKNYNDSRKIIHDIRNHLNMLEQSAKLEGDSYFEDVHGMLNSLGMKFYTDNRMLNIVLNDKLKKLEPGQAECNLGGIAMDFLADVDVTTIFANLLDNAIEAGENRKNFWLKIRGEQIQDFTVVKIWNPSAGDYVPGRSGKKGHEGLGLENVRNAVQKYHGALNIENRDGIFSAALVFPGQT
ncbi:MAG TPA: GHKL domain-containing protein [Candidatus Blautia excrementipullorum]|nr:GHKL domain-containing protein [Candidatus Blautia excrementipullorum]